MATQYPSSRQSDLEKVSCISLSMPNGDSFVFIDVLLMIISLFRLSLDMVGAAKWHKANFCSRTKPNQNTVHGFIYVSCEIQLVKYWSLNFVCWVKLSNVTPIHANMNLREFLICFSFLSPFCFSAGRCRQIGLQLLYECAAEWQSRSSTTQSEQENWQQRRNRRTIVISRCPIGWTGTVQATKRFSGRILNRFAFGMCDTTRSAELYTD